MSRAIDRTVLWVGTRKGLHRFASDGDRRAWRADPPLLQKWNVDAILPDPDDPDRLLVGTSHEAWGTTLRETADGGETWEESLLRPPAEEGGHPIHRIWQIARGPTGTLYAGVDEAALFESEDDGRTWAEVEGLSRHPSRPHWMPGAGGLCLHTILVDPDDPARMWVGISAVGVFFTADGGETWEARNEGLPPMRATGSPDGDAMFCVHKIALDPADPDRLFLQFHAHTMTPDGERSSGVFRSDDAAASWRAIDGDLPRRFGFPMVVSEKGELFVAPLVSDANRVFDEGRPVVWRSGDGGESWQGFDIGPPDEPVYSGVLRDAMAVDGLEPTGVYLGTTGGDVFASAEAGETWGRLPGRLPRVLCVRSATYG
ncbi:MAG: exo-alpha-sialidase [Gemmatimonadota bacterium]|nr:exo-alpha-sialidase [Gemmatimonadota bacterium]